MNFELLFKKAKERGIEDIQIYLNERKSLSIKAFRGELDNYSISDSTRLSVKGIFNKKMGSISTEILDDSNIDFIIDTIISSATVVTSKDEVFIYEGDKEYLEVENLFNSELEEIQVSKEISDIFDVEKLALSLDPRVDKVEVYFEKSSDSVTIKNSKGLELNKKTNSAVFAVQSIANENEETRTAMDFLLTNNYENFNLEEMAKASVAEATSKLGAKPCKSGKYEILLRNDASADMLATFSSMFSADQVQKGLSILKDKIGKDIINKNITIFDDPTIANNSRAGSFDDEGVATKKKSLIKNGVLEGYLYNLKTAKKDNVKSTGNGFGGGVSTTSLYIENGDTNFDNAVASMKNGIIITELAGLHSGANPINGNFSLQTSGLLVEDGKIIRPLALITVAGNYLELLKDVTEVCSDIKYDFSGTGSPSLKISSLAISGE
ncbi:MAG: TldD/PmbA family protein [Psychrilyobacter sp.]|nr:TldD/PmbA family protein [Psychrilyobacter sp.]